MKSTHLAKLSLRAIRLACLSAVAVGGMTISMNTLAATASGPASGQVVTPIAIATGATLSFGRFTSALAGTVVVSTAGVRSVTGGVTAMPGGTAAAAATFAVSGEPNSTYTISVPAGVSTLTGSVSGTMDIDTYTTNPGLLLGALDGTGAQTLLVGGTLNVGAAQPRGTYTGTVTIGVDYN